MQTSWTSTQTDTTADSHTTDPEQYTPARGRNPESSVAAQYEDSVPPDATYFPYDEEHEPS